MTHASFPFEEADLRLIKQRLRVAVVHGGDVHEPENYIRRTKSLRTTKTYRQVAEDIAQGLHEAGFEQVFVLSESLHLAEQLSAYQVDLVFINSGGLQGADAMTHLPALLEMLGIPYVGHQPMTAGILDNKHLFKKFVMAEGISSAPFILVRSGDRQWLSHHAVQLAEMERHFGEGYIVKPVCGRASLHVYRVADQFGLLEKVQQVQAETGNDVLIEPYLSGPEYVVSVCGGFSFRQQRLVDHHGPFAFSVIERLLDKGEAIFTSMDVKPITASRVKLVVDPEVRDALTSMATKIYQALDLHSLVRVDVRKGSDNKFYVLEANPKPDLKRPNSEKISLVCHGLSEESMSYVDLIQSLVFNRLAYLKSHRPDTLPTWVIEQPSNPEVGLPT
ncbi:D-alanine--D-alanine ligase family protein [Thaumasiovibrio subtropicus]|uniref:D-alanine--D-alanine ligase family protein n=1 Tax=Thaumasiovibrio subtropicus TaxID=1891207 RepID=UPI000B34D206|nr:hypothetical protein [Thaumasiovibrio subtropicus]